MKLFILAIAIAAIASLAGCSKSGPCNVHYFQVGIKYLDDPTKAVLDWRDTAFEIAVTDPTLLLSIYEDLKQPIANRHHIFGEITRGSGGYNHNAGFWFNWHYKESTIELVGPIAEAFDGLPYTDVDLNPVYWIDTLGAYGSWGSYISKELRRP